MEYTHKATSEAATAVGFKKGEHAEASVYGVIVKDADESQSRKYLVLYDEGLQTFFVGHVARWRRMPKSGRQALTPMLMPPQRLKS